MCDRLIRGMLWCADVHWSLTRAHPHERVPVFVTADQQATSVLFFLGSCCLSQGALGNTCVMMAVMVRKSALALLFFCFLFFVFLFFCSAETTDLGLESGLGVIMC